MAASRKDRRSGPADPPVAPEKASARTARPSDGAARVAEAKTPAGREEASSRRLREQAELLDLAHDSIFVHDMDGRITFWNRGAEKTYGWTRQEALGKIGHTLLRTRFPGPLAKLTGKLLRSGHWEGELVHTTRDGRRITVASRWALRRDAAGEPVAILEIDNDITQRKAAEEALRRSNELLESMFANTHMGLAWMDPDFNFVRVNAAYAAAGGHEPDYYVGRNHFELYPHPENQAVFRRAVQRAEPVSFTERPFEYPDHPEDGVTYWDWTLRPVADADGRVIGVLLSLLDVTDRVRSRRRAEEERKRLFTVLNMLPVYVALIDEDHRIRFANDGYLEAFSEPAGRCCHEVQYGLDAPCEDCPIPHVLRTGRAEDWEWTYPNGRTYHAWAFPFTDADGSPLTLHLGLDVTERKSLELMVSEAGEAERRRIGRDLHDTVGQSLTGLGYLVGSLSERLAAMSPDSAALAGQLVETVNETVAQLRGMARGLDPVGLEADGLANALGELVETVRTTSDVDCEFRCRRPVRLEAFAATHLYRIAQEAVNNAVKHAGADRITLSLREAGGDVVLAVVDGEPMLRRLSVRDGVEVLTADRGRPGPEDAATAEILGVMVGVLRLKRRVLGVG